MTANTMFYDFCCTNVQNRFFYSALVSVWFLKKNSDSVQNKFGLVRFEKMQFGSDIIVTYYLCNSKVVNLQPILQSYCNV